MTPDDAIKWAFAFFVVCMALAALAMAWSEYRD